MTVLSLRLLAVFLLIAFLFAASIRLFGMSPGLLKSWSVLLQVIGIFIALSRVKSRIVKGAEAPSFEDIERRFKAISSRAKGLTPVEQTLKVDWNIGQADLGVFGAAIADLKVQFERKEREARSGWPLEWGAAFLVIAGIVLGTFPEWMSTLLTPAFT